MSLSEIEYNNSKNFLCGTPGYIAPEVLHKISHGFKADIFNCGIIMYVLLTGVSPFHASSIFEIIKKNTLCEIQFPEKLFDPISSSALDLIKKMTEVNPIKRFNAEECLRHKH